MCITTVVIYTFDKPSEENFCGLRGIEINLAGIFYNIFVWLYLSGMYTHKHTNILVQKIKLDQTIDYLDFLAVKARSIWQQ